MTVNTPLQQRLLAVMESDARYTAAQLAGVVGEETGIIQRELVRLAARDKVETDGDRCASHPIWTVCEDSYLQ